MQSRQTSKRKIGKLPSVWLMTDERLGDDLVKIVKRLPRGSGIVFRHYSLPTTQRRALFEKLRKIARQRNHIILLSAATAQARRWGADGIYGYERSVMLQAAPVHDARELAKAARLQADILFISPIFQTASHPEAPTLGISGFRRLAARARDAKAIALGGMSPQRARKLGAKTHGWAAIDAFKT